MKKAKNGRTSIKKPWTTKAAMEQVYAKKLWGEGRSPFYSGEGSHHPEIVKPYIELITSFFKSFNSPLVVCDLGCGDFNIGKALVKHTKHYVAVDIVADLIDHNKEKFKASNLEFQRLDIAEDHLPSGDCVVLRQVLQHVSNAEIQKILSKLRQYKYVIVTEHVPEGDFEPNVDIISGQGIRLKKRSGVNVLAPPFNFKVKEEQQLSTVLLDNKKGQIKTTLYTIF